MRLKIIHHPGTNDFPGFRTEGIPVVGEVRDFDGRVAEKLLAMNLAAQVPDEPEPKLAEVPAIPKPVKQGKSK
jgi:hypothetical protein